MKNLMKSVALSVAALGLTVAGAQAATLDDVKAKGFVQCGVSQGLPGFSNPDDKGSFYEPSDDKIYRHPTFYNLPDEVGHM